MSQFLYNNNLKYRFSRHFLFFVATVLAFTSLLFVQKSNGTFIETLFITFVNALFFFSYAYITIFLLIPEFLLKKKMLWFILLFILIGIALSALKLVVSDQIFYAAISPENIERRGLMNLRFMVVNTKDMTFIVAFFCIAKYVKDYLYTDRLRKELEIQTKETQRKLFQSQFDPHFLFNTINNLYALSLLNPSKTKEVIARVKIVLNYVIEEIQKEFVSLQQEISLAESFVQLEKLRYGKRLKVEFNLEGEMELYRMPPMILFFLIENSFKHGCSLDAGSPWIKIEIKALKGEIFIAVENSKPKEISLEGKMEKRNFQLINLKKRLEIMYGSGGYQMQIINTEKSFKVEIELKEEIEIRQNKYR